jgi:dTDP-4-dehydrorhamnose 3,5-epimerase
LDPIVSAVKDEPHVTPDWQIAIDLIEGVQTREVRNVVTANGVTTEVHRDDWGIVGGGVQQVIHVSLRAGAISAWHMHREQTDHIVPTAGMIRVVVYDPREASPSHGRVEVFNLSPMRPSLLLIPPGLWHGVQNMIASEFSSFINLFDRPYEHDDPDEWRLPIENDQIPYEFDPA